MPRLDWPDETVAVAGEEAPRRFHAGSNPLADCHGDPCTADLAVLSDGNHHMARGAALRAFRADRPHVREVFYATTPPRWPGGCSSAACSTWAIFACRCART